MKHAVIIPSYNHAKYLGAALDSVLNQTRRPDRILVIDDGSADDSPEIIRQYAARGVEGYARENQGAHATLNELVKWASTDCGIVSILNSDDHYHPERFATLLPILESEPRVQTVVSGLRVMDSEDRDIDPDSPRGRWFRAVWSMYNPGRDLAEWLGIANFPATTSNVTARAAWMLRYPFKPYRFNHDYYFLAQTVLHDAMAVHPAALVNYRVHATNTMNSEPAPLLREMLRMTLDLAHDLAPELPGDPALRARWSRYARAQWDSISSFHGGLYQTLLAQSMARFTEEEIRQLVTALTLEQFEELATYPNKSLVNQWDGHSPVAEGAGPAARYEASRAAESQAKSLARGYKVLSTERGRLLDSRWLALGRLLGTWKPPALPSGTPVNQAEALPALLAEQSWVSLGQRLGFLPKAPDSPDKAPAGAPPQS